MANVNDVCAVDSVYWFVHGSPKSSRITLLVHSFRPIFFGNIWNFHRIFQIIRISDTDAIIIPGRVKLFLHRTRDILSPKVMLRKLRKSDCNLIDVQNIRNNIYVLCNTRKYLRSTILQNEHALKIW